jgi:hypothetical protein
LTTNIYDIPESKLASDSRWSIDRSDFLIFVDDTGCEKIIFENNVACMFAGNGRLIDIWKEWILNPNRGEKPPVEIENVAVVICMVSAVSNKLIFEHGQGIQIEDARFAGTGAIHAYSCWFTNRNAEQAVISAIKSDCYSGGTVKYFDCKSKINNLKNSANIDQVHSELAIRGSVMYKNNENRFISIKDAASNDPSVANVLSDLQSGAIAANAPCDAMYNKWPEEKIKELHYVLDEYFPGN